MTLVPQTPHYPDGWGSDQISQAPWKQGPGCWGAVGWGAQAWGTARPPAEAPGAL